MAEGGHGPVLPKKYEFDHVRDKPHGVSVVLNPNRLFLSLKRSAEELPRSFPRLNELNDMGTDKYCLKVGYFPNCDLGRTKKPSSFVISSSKDNDMEKRLKLFGMPLSSFPSEAEALTYTAVFKNVAETINKTFEELPAWKETKESSDEQWARIQMCNSHRSSGERLRTAHGCLGSLQIKF
jgi:hypothetical protein